MLDLIVALTLIVSAIVGFARGAVRELLAVLAFVAAVLIAVAALRFSMPLTNHVIRTAWAAEAVALLIVFVAAFILLKVFGGGLIRKLHDMPVVGMLDRLIGLGFGLVRALVLLGLFNLLLTVATPAGRTPAWVTDAKLYPVTATGAAMLKALAPKGYAVAGKVGPVLSKAVKGAAHDSLQDNDKDPAYEAPTRKNAD
jgi:membrane protein required for colicin V production